MDKLIAAVVCSAAFGTFAEPTTNTPARIVVTATRTPVEITTIGSSLSVISESDIQRYQTRTVFDAVNTAPGVSFNQNGGAGQPSSVYIRGSKAEHVKIYIDGVAINDPTTTANLPDMAHLNTDNIEQIEVLRGPQSTLYGSDAIGGVINIRTKRGAGKPIHFIDMEAGSFNTFRTAIGSQGGADTVDYNVSVSRFETEGYSAMNGSGEEDGYKNTTIQSRIGIQPLENARIDFIVRHVDAEGDYDDAYAVNPPADKSRFDTDQTFLRTEGTLSLFDGIWEQKAGLSLTDIDRDYSWGGYNGKILTADWQNDILLNEMNTLTAGAEWEQESYLDSFGGKYNDESVGFYLQDQIQIGENFFGTAGIRHEEHQQVGQADTYRLIGTYLIDESGTKLKASWGTGFRAPSLYQLYAPYGTGNASLKPEESEGWEAGFEQTLIKDKLTGGITYFQSHLENTISYYDSDPTDYISGMYVQSASVNTRGLETFLDWTATDSIKVRLNHTWLDVEDQDPSRYAELRKPEHEFNAQVDFQATDKLNLYLRGSYVGKRDDVGGVVLDEYITLDIGGGYQVTSNLLVYARIENLTDEDYELVDGYGTAGISAYAGAKFTF
ncbi:MAG: TonB-dependent receptor [Kiritimatiellaeota bacterium]|nr:TonB-dependent receptor [Kiritimatiellota bacterium]